MKKTVWILTAGVLFAGTLAAAVPSLKGSAEPAGRSGLKVRAFSGSQAIPAATPKAERYQWTRGDETGEVMHYIPREIWLQDAWGCQWKDRKGNLLTLATVKALCPDGDHEDKAVIEKALAESAASFKEPTNETLATWASQFSEKNVEAAAIKPFAAGGVLEARLVDWQDATRCGAFFKSKDGVLRFVEFRFAQEAKPKDAERLLKTFLANVVVDKSAKAAGMGGELVEGKWTTVKIPGYVFKTDLPKGQRGAFLKDTSKIMTAMRAAYRRYVPPQRVLKDCTIRVFATKADYVDYLKNNCNGGMLDSIGLWNPDLEELLILTQGKSVSERRETMKILRHEAFHQYLHYATGNGNHAMWFNEGHATFFESILYSPKSDTVRFFEDVKDTRVGLVTANPQKYANMLAKILPMSHNEFYGGNLTVVNDKYTAAWALTYFLEKGVPSFEELAAYRKVLPTYLKETAAGTSASEATKIAWEGLEGSLSADFMKFWNKRNGARNYEPPAVPEPKAETK